MNKEWLLFNTYCRNRGIELTPKQKDLAYALMKDNNLDGMRGMGSGKTLLFSLIEDWCKEAISIENKNESKSIKEDSHEK